MITTKPYSIKGLGKTIILPHCRFIPTEGRKGKMFHSITRTLDGKNVTIGCDRVDDSGFCTGHEMTHKEFITHICNGVEPETWTAS